MKRRRLSPATSFTYSELEPKRLLAGDLGELNLLVNGDFSDVPVSEVRPNFFDSDSVAGWQAANGEDGQQIVLYTFGTGDDANTVLKLDSTADQIDLLEQDVAVEAGETYIVTFDLRGQVVDGILVSETVEVLWDGEVIGEFEGTSRPTTHAMIVQGSDTGVSTLGFREAADGDSASGNGVGVLLDNVNVALAEESDGVTNGSFEESSGTGPFFSNGNIPGWTALDRGGRPDLIQLQSSGDNVNVSATDGSEFLNLDTTGDVVDHVFADFATTEGASYFVTFDVFADGPQDANPDELRVRWKTADSDISTDQWIATVFGNNRWQSYGFMVEGLGDLSRLELREPTQNAGDGSGALIDNVRLFLVEDAPVDTNPLALAAIATQTVEAGSPLFVALDITNPNNEALTYSAVSADSSIVTASFESGDSWRLNVSAPDVTTDGVSTPLSGELTFQLIETIDGEESRATERIRELTNDGFYDGIEFHRVIDGFVIQGGDPTATGSGGSDLGDFDDQFSTLLQHNQAGLLSYAKSSDDTNDSQFFITDDATRSLDFQHTIFGVLTSGDDLRAAINDLDTGTNPNSIFAGDYPIGSVTIDSAEIYQDNERAAVLLNVPEGASGQTTLTVTVEDQSGNVTSQEITVNVVAPTDALSDGSPFLNDIPDLSAQIGVETTFQLTAEDVEDDTLRFLDLEDIQDINDNLEFGQTPISIPSFTVTPLFNYDVENDSGLLSFTPLAGSPDTIEFLVGVVQADATVDNRNIDMQVVTVNVSS